MDDYIAEDHLVRVIDVFIERQNLDELGLEDARPAATGRPGYDPRAMFKLYVYGYFNQVRSSRKLEREAGRNLELMWLLGKLKPDFKTIADFRKDRGKAIQGLFRAFTRFCMGQGLITGELVGIDGSKFRAVNSKARNDNAKKLEKHLAALEAKGKQYLEELERTDAEEAGQTTPDAETLRAAITTLEARKDVVKARQKALQDSNQKQLSHTDPDSRAMRSGMGQNMIGYNVQTSVDSAEKMIVSVEPVQDGNDRQQLASQAEQVKHILGQATLSVVADRGYDSGEQLERCEQAGITAYVPPAKPPQRDSEKFSRDAFTYNADADTYQCPANQTLTYQSTSHSGNRQVRRYTTDACLECALKAQCTSDTRGRTVTRDLQTAARERAKARMAAHPEMMQTRKCLVEHPFGTIKRHLNQSYFLMKGLPNVRTEISLSALVYNLKRAINVIGARAMLQAMG
ncbi:MAG: IS1182 family transposase [Salinisphaera sp.]|nr:IS1182 family transposase [Salinisphaera sp.]